MGGSRSHRDTLLHSCPQGQMLSAAGFRLPGVPGRNPLPPGGDQRETRFLQGLGKWGQGLPPDLPLVTSTTSTTQLLNQGSSWNPYFPHFTPPLPPLIVQLPQTDPPLFSPLIFVIASQLVSLLPVWTTTLVSTQKLG